ncbi:hypothetical protein KAFR_0G01560 [Kazachstania africana CBS 2517]|uniref:K Homology domain-containing protein n=1 Tax=Kazachstania africana (strain ATCC 22294 / BCRC 22015 / CBS 2517 / CECT 1963 / NBRC 1671 / NRRL Y-8276) TaxID=1071382 RepID=H2AXU0_KAZAF|nr:hypothetical protein KAFR_0G01560 [Kazachstania africana CBS 2517]CCF59190.1 hypothetical protein KAFR_0G01560 [Kazachstania africana CBS 2517]
MSIEEENNQSASPFTTESVEKTPVDETEVGRESSTESNSIEVSKNSPILYRVLLSYNESGKVIGHEAKTLKTLRDTNDIQITLSEKVQGCSDRVLSIGGSIVNVANTINDIIKLFVEDTEQTASKHYPFSFLNSMLPEPKIEDFEGCTDVNAIRSVRLLLSNSKIPLVFGKNGDTLKKLQEGYKVKIIGSKRTLPDSDDRLLEIQGESQHIADCIVEVGQIILNKISFEQLNEIRYTPHLSKSKTNGSQPIRNQKTEQDSDLQTFSATVLVPEPLVGGLIGVKGNRIISLRKYTKTKITTLKNEDEKTHNDEGEEMRKFVITGHSVDNVKKAESLLVKNLDALTEERAMENEKNGKNVEF